MSDLIELRIRALAAAERYVGVREHGGPNRGPQIERWLARVHLEPGAPWCMAYACCMFEDAAKGLHMENPLPMVGSVAKMFSWVMANRPHWVSSKPTRGALFLHFSDPQNPHGKGHTGFVTGTDEDSKFFQSVEGNTNDAGSREGDGVWNNRRATQYAFCFVDIGREGPAAA